MSKDHAELKGVVQCTVLRVGQIVPLAWERSHVVLVRHILIMKYACSWVSRVYLLWAGFV